MPCSMPTATVPLTCGIANCDAKPSFFVHLAHALSGAEISMIVTTSFLKVRLKNLVTSFIQHY